MTREQRYRDGRAVRDDATLQVPFSEPAYALAEITADKVLICRQCGKEFIFGIGEQQFYSQRGLSQPRRCPECRAERRAERNNGYRKAGNGYAVKCTGCGKETTVPFEPQEGRPVYCWECYLRLKRDTGVSLDKRLGG